MPAGGERSIRSMTDARSGYAAATAAACFPRPGISGAGAARPVREKWSKMRFAGRRAACSLPARHGRFRGARAGLFQPAPGRSVGGSASGREWRLPPNDFPPTCAARRAQKDCGPAASRAGRRPAVPPAARVCFRPVLSVRRRGERENGRRSCMRRAACAETKASPPSAGRCSVRCAVRIGRKALWETRAASHPTLRRAHGEESLPPVSGAGARPGFMQAAFFTPACQEGSS